MIHLTVAVQNGYWNVDFLFLKKNVIKFLEVIKVTMQPTQGLPCLPSFIILKLQKIMVADLYSETLQDIFPGPSRSNPSILRKDLIFSSWEFKSTAIQQNANK